MRTISDNCGKCNDISDDVDAVWISSEILTDAGIAKLPDDEWVKRFADALRGADNEFSQYIMLGGARQ